MAALPLKTKIGITLDAHRKLGTVGKCVNGALVLLILLNVAAVMAVSVNRIYIKYTDFFDAFEVFSVGIFSLEYLLRVWSVPALDEDKHVSLGRKRLNYLLSPMALIDLLAILPFYLGLFIQLDLRFLRIIRLIRVVKLGRYSQAMQMLLTVFREEYRVLLAALFILLILMVVASSGIYLIEHDVQPDNFGSIPQAMWWAMATLTTVGYGDVTPITPLGKLFGGTITVISMAMVALPAGILASSFSEQLRKRRDKFRASIKAALSDGELDLHELEQLDVLRRSLDIDKEDAEELFKLIHMQKHHSTPECCPHCGERIGDGGNKT